MMIQTPLPPQPNYERPIVEALRQEVNSQQSPFKDISYIQDQFLYAPETQYGYVEEGSAKFMEEAATSFIRTLTSSRYQQMSRYQVYLSMFLSGLSTAAIRKLKVENLMYYVGDIESPRDIYSRVSFNISGSSAYFHIVSDQYSTAPHFNVQAYDSVKGTYESRLYESVEALLLNVEAFIGEVS